MVSAILLPLLLLVLNGVELSNARVTQARAYVYKAVQSPEQNSLEPIGVVDFTDVGGGSVAVNGTLRGLAPGQHGFHVHQLGDLAQLCVAAGPHFNPHGKTHAAPQDQNRHVGDLGNVQADQNGVVTLNMRDSLLALEGVNSVLGRGLVVHEKADDLGQGGNEESKKTGNAGKRVGCGVIGVKAEQQQQSGDVPDSAVGQQSGRLLWVTVMLLLLLSISFGITY